MTKDATNDTICVDFARARLKHSTDMLHTQTRALFAYWDQLRAGRDVPFRSEINPREMNCDARHLFILEHLGNSNIRFRLAGSAIGDAFGMELRGMSIRAIMEGKSRESIAALIAEVLDEPGVGYARLIEDSASATNWEIVLLPLRSDFGKIDRVIGALHPVSGAPSQAGIDVSSLRFIIDEMAIRPLDRPAPSFVEAPERLQEFAEPMTPFHGPGQTARLKTIEGGKAERDGDARDARSRPSLRIVKDD
ncbi:PAS domain-containing protein [Rhodobacteraceae bacterium NNCM2]|nr:PAS domain-containing protein [Coraliihabitans acroporae]